MLPSTLALSSKLRNQMGDAAFIRWLKNLGFDFEDAYQIMFQKLPNR